MQRIPTYNKLIKRFKNWSILHFFSLCFFILIGCQTSEEKKSTEASVFPAFNFYIGAYTQNEDEGIYIANLNGENGELKLTGVAAVTPNPSFLSISGEFIFAVNELNGRDGTITSFAIDHRTLRLYPIDTLSSGGVAPCFVSIDPSGYVGYVANYGNGSLLRFEVDNTGHFLDSAIRVQHEGKGADEKRQAGPHAHSIDLHPSGSPLLAADLGIDRLMIYEPSSMKKLGEITFPGGSGPRHFTFNREGTILYVINELNSTIASFSYKNGEFESIQVISTLPGTFTENNSTADIHISPSGKMLYGSNRGHDSIVSYEINDEGGLENPEWLQENISQPRNFALSPDGNWLIVANQRGNSVNSYRILENGRPAEMSSSFDVHSPVCIKFLP